MLGPFNGASFLRCATLKPAALLTVSDFMSRVSMPVSEATAPQPDWWRAMGMPFQHTPSGRVCKEERKKSVLFFFCACDSAHMFVRECVFVCM